MYAFHVKDLSAEGRAEFDRRLAADEETPEVIEQQAEEARKASIRERAGQLGYNPVVVQDAGT